MDKLLLIDDETDVQYSFRRIFDSPEVQLTTASSGEEGLTRAETEGVFVVRDGRVAFVSVETGIAGDRYFEALSGVREGDQVVIGPFEVVRNLKDGDAVRVSSDAARR